MVVVFAIGLFFSVAGSVGLLSGAEISPLFVWLLGFGVSGNLAGLLLEVTK